jgi:hypothetical protein
MKSILIMVIIWISIDSNSAAQTNQYLRVKAGDNPTKTIPLREQYHYPEFIQGKLLFTNNSSSTARFNYNLLLGEMHFIDTKGDTLALASDPTIKLVSIGQDLFYYEYPKTYWMIRSDYGSGKLVVKRTIALIDKEKQGGYGQSTGTSSIRNTTTFSGSNGSLAKLNAQADLVFLRKEDYKLMDKNKAFYPATQSGFLRLFSKNKPIIKRYLQENHIDFRREEDLKRVLDFCTNIP